MGTLFAWAGTVMENSMAFEGDVQMMMMMRGV